MRLLRTKCVSLERKICPFLYLYRENQVNGDYTTTKKLILQYSGCQSALQAGTLCSPDSAIHPAEIFFSPLLYTTFFSLTPRNPPPITFPIFRPLLGEIREQLAPRQEISTPNETSNGTGPPNVNDNRSGFLGKSIMIYISLSH